MYVYIYIYIYTSHPNMLHYQHYNITFSWSQRLRPERCRGAVARRLARVALGRLRGFRSGGEKKEKESRREGERESKGEREEQGEGEGECEREEEEGKGKGKGKVAEEGEEGRGGPRGGGQKTPCERNGRQGLATGSTLMGTCVGGLFPRGWFQNTIFCLKQYGKQPVLRVA